MNVFTAILTSQPYPAYDYFKRHKFKEPFALATQTETVKTKVKHFLKALSQIRQPEALASLFSEHDLL